MGHWIFMEEHDLFRASVKKFVDKEVVPQIEQWEHDGEIPRMLYERMGELGYLGIQLPQEFGGSGLDVIMEAVFIEEMGKCGAGGVGASIGAHTGLAMTPIWRFGSEEQKQKYLVPGIKGKLIGCLGITEPNAGSDVSAISTRAIEEGDHYLLNGSKMFITNGVNADYAIVAAKTNLQEGHRGISLFIVDKASEGFSVSTKLKKLGWRSSDTGELIFDNVKVPKENVLGHVNRGFYMIMQNFQWERIMLALGCVSLAEKALEDTMRYSNERVQFGKPLAQFQVLRHKMVDMAVDLEKARHITYRALYLFANGQDASTETTMAKVYAAEMVNRVADHAMQIHGGNGYMMEFPVQRYWRDARIQPIGGGTTQIMREILTKRLGIVE